MWMILKVNKLLLISAALILLMVWPMLRTARSQEPSNASSTPALSDWKTYTVKGEEFSVSLPGRPAMTTQITRILKQHRDRQERVIGGYADGVVYAIYTFENPKRRQSLEDLIAEFPRDYENKTPLDVTLAGFGGKQYEVQEGDRKGVSQFYITDWHIYLFKAVGSSLGNPDIAIPKFISSIRLEKNPKGIEVSDGPGEQPNSDPNASSEVPTLTGKEMTRKASVITKPEPSYTEEARRNDVTGTVVLRCVFSSSGAVTNIRAVSGLPFGLTEKAISAARQIRFIPAIKDGHFVSMYIQLEYNFNLY
jgi:TonB family protein